jgi:hypothetical protein
MAFVLRIVGLRSGAQSPLDCQFLRAWEPGKAIQAHGRVLPWIKITPDIEEAQRFATPAEMATAARCLPMFLCTALNVGDK